MICSLCGTYASADRVKTIDGNCYDISCIREYHKGRKTPDEIEEIIKNMKEEYFNYKRNIKIEQIRKRGSL